MGRVVFVLLLASSFATGLGLECYQCVSDSSWLEQFNVTLPYHKNCNSSSFNPDGVATVTLPVASSISDILFVPDQCFKWVITDKGSGKGEVIVRDGAHILALTDPPESIPKKVVSATNSSRDLADTVHDIVKLAELSRDLVNYFGSLVAADDAIAVAFCDSNLCNSVSGLRHSSAVLAMSAVVLMATLAHAYN